MRARLEVAALPTGEHAEREQLGRADVATWSAFQAVDLVGVRVGVRVGLVGVRVAVPARI